MTKRRRKLLLLVAAVAMCLILLIASLRSSERPTVFRLKEARAYVIPKHVAPLRHRGDRQVEADIEYVGPPLSPRVGTFKRFMMRLGLVRSPAAPRWHIEDIVLLDAQGRELHRMATGSMSNAATRPWARGGFMEDPRNGRLVHVWTFDFPAHIDPATPVTFRTRLGVNNHAPVLIEVKLPALPATTTPFHAAEP